PRNRRATRMRDLDPQLERDFFAVFETYYNLETRRNNDYTTEEYSLDRMLPLVEAADNPELGLRVIHVAGTKGKGSTAFLLEALLRSAGHRVGVFTSPHLATVRERFQVAGKLLPYERLIETGRRLEARVREAGITPSLFEVFTVLSLGLFAESDCEFAIRQILIQKYLPRFSKPKTNHQTQNRKCSKNQEHTLIGINCS
ncbi:MAG: hypothetical protein QGG64_19110, partial [Candidatus Latescibacteria bacterium]|nr:hypothetical protein [Candidatus Latescibacterota bacterium]